MSQKGFEEFLDRMLKAYQYKAISKEEDICKYIVDTLIGTQSTIRSGSIPSKEVYDEVKRRVTYKVNRNEPIEVSCAWGALKTNNMFGNCPDLAELLAVQQYCAINRMVKERYSPGVKFNLFLGDSYYEYLYGETEEVEKYCKHLEKMVEKYNEIITYRLSVMIKKKQLEQCENNYKILKQYYMESDCVCEEEFEQLESYKQLIDIGWVGNISPAMRAFYLKRMQGLYPNENRDFWIDKIIHFFAYGLMISQNDLMGRRNIDRSTIDSCLLRVPPPDLPRKLYSNRLRMRIAPVKICKHSAPPWTVNCIIVVNDSGGPRIRIVNHLAEYNIEVMDTFYWNGIEIPICRNKNF